MQPKVSMILVLWPVKIISLISSQVNRLVGRKGEIPEEKQLTTRKQNLDCLTCPYGGRPYD